MPAHVTLRSLFVLVCATALAHGAEPPLPRQITVSGEAEVKVAPDQVILTLAIETNDKDLMVAERQNEERVKKVLALAKEFKIEPRHIQTAELTVEPRYETYDRKREFLGYFVTKTIVLCLKDMTRFEELLTACLRAGTNNVQGVQFQNTELRKLRDQARAMAMRAAREKATAMAGELGQKLARPRTITELAVNQWSSPRNSGYQSMMQNAMVSAPSAGEGSDTFAPGQVGVTASVQVTFDLAD